VNFETGETRKEKEISLQFLPFLYMPDELQELQNFLGENSLKIIFVTKKTFLQVLNNPTRFSFSYDVRGWSKNAKDNLSAESRRELLAEIMTALKTENGFQKKEIET
jgi:hypothetical protein